MLKKLHIENYALINESDIVFDKGFVAITGETGAGKSIMLGAISLLLGQRADSKVLRDTTRKCIIEALFDVRGLNIKELFIENDVDYYDDSVIIRREILPNAKSRAFVNDTPVQLTFLKELGTELIDIHSQHASLLLGDREFQISLVDTLSDNNELLQKYRTTYKLYTEQKHQLEQLTVTEQQNRKEYDYNKFLFDELADANLAEDEQEQLEKESSLLSNAETIKQALAQVIEICDGEENSAIQRLNIAKSTLSRITNFDGEILSSQQRLESSIIELRDIMETLEKLDEEIFYSPERQEQVDERLNIIYRLQKKHGAESIAQLLEIKKTLEDKLLSVDNMDGQIQKLMEAVDLTFKQLQKEADDLTSSRQKGAKRLQNEIIPLLANVGMPNATLQVTINNAEHYNIHGNNQISILFNANKGGQMREISKVASGGEMSRLMLAIKALTARARLLPTVIFDEIDTGISGTVSLKVGSIMQQMAENMQLIAITHLPQIAARATQHYMVYKDDEGATTTSRIKLLNIDERRHNLAVMLSSDPPSQAALKTAGELMSDKNATA